MAQKPQGSRIEDFDIIDSFIGYINKPEITNTNPKALVVGSKNVIVNDSDKLVGRKGFTLDGQASTVNNGIDSSFDFVSRNGTIILRSFAGATANTGKLQVRMVESDDSVVWYDLLTGLTYSDFCYSQWWYDTEVTRTLIFVDGTSTVRMWGGAIARVASNTATTITLEGTETFAQKGFFASLSGRSITIPGVGSYVYTGGETTTTLTGLTGLPAIPVGTPIFQTVVADSSLGSVPSGTTFDITMVKDNHVWLGSTKSAVVYGSKTSDWTDYGFTTPLRLPTDGFKITLDTICTGFNQEDGTTYIHGGTDDIIKVEFVLSADTGEEAIKFEKLRTGKGQSALSQKAIIPVKNGTMYFTHEQTLSWLTQVQNVFTPQSLPISDPIKNDFDSFDLTGATGVFFRNDAWFAIPRENLVYIYDFDKQLWNTPLTIPVSSFSIIDNELYGHSNSKNETYKLNDGLSDNGVDIEYTMAFAYRSYGKRTKYKEFDEYYTELYMSTSTDILLTENFEYQGSGGVTEQTISGTDTNLMFASSADASLGKNPLGSNPLGSNTTGVGRLNKYRCFSTMQKVAFFEHQTVYSTSSPNAEFELICHGANVGFSPNIPTSLMR